MEMIPQGYVLWAVAVEHPTGAEPVSTATMSTGQVIAWQRASETSLMPVIMWSEGPATALHGTAVVASEAWKADHSIGLGTTRQHAEAWAMDAERSRRVVRARRHDGVS